MPRYSIATTKDNLSKLIDKALAGEEVVITRHGEPVVELHVVATGREPSMADRKAALDRLTAVRESLPAMTTPYLELKRLDEADYER